MGKSFALQRGFAAFSVSVEQGHGGPLHPHTGQPSREDGLRFRIDCVAKKHGVPYDPKYAFD
jgi:hypothetical protein